MLLLEDKTQKLINLVSEKVCEDTYIEDESDYCVLDDIFYWVDKDGFYDLVTDRGASKFVINDNISPFVVKIPFVGSCESAYDSELEEYTDDYEYYDFCGANDSDGWDYCKDEVNKYKIAAEAGFGEFFPFTALATVNKHGIPIYISERVNTNWATGSVSEASKTKAKTLSTYKRDDFNCTFINETFVAKCIDYYGYKRTEEFITWLHTQPEIVEDLHGGNFGQRFNGGPVILDFSGFRN